MAKIVTKAPLDIMTLNPARYQEVGETIQQHACQRMFSLGMSCLRSSGAEEAITRTLDNYNENHELMKAADKAEDSFEKMSAEPDEDQRPKLTREEMEREIGRWKYVRQCTLQRNTTSYIHQHNEPYTVTDAYDFRMKMTGKDASETFAESSANTLARVTGGLVDKEVRFKSIMKQGSGNIISLDKIGRPAVAFVRDIERLEEMPIEWDEAWTVIVKKVANNMTKQWGITDDEIINRIAIMQGLDELGDPVA